MWKLSTKRSRAKDRDAHWLARLQCTADGRAFGGYGDTEAEALKRLVEIMSKSLANVRPLGHHWTPLARAVVRALDKGKKRK